MEANKQCKKCGGVYNLIAFRIIERATYRLHSRYHTTCRLCEQDKRDEQKRKNRFIYKAKKTLMNHGKKYGYKLKAFCEEFGWDIRKLAHEMKHAYRNGCLECGELYSTMGGGTRNLTLDIIDPSQKPYPHNSRLICFTCNNEKKNYSPNEYGEYKKYCRQWKENKKNRPPIHKQKKLFG